MCSVTLMKTAKTGYVIVSALLCILGILSIAVPNILISLFGTVCGLLLIAFGIVRLMGYFSKDLYRLAFQYDLALGVMTIALGVLMLFYPKGLTYFISLSLGFAFLADGLFKIQMSFDAKKFGIYKWWLILSLAVMTGIFGIVLIFHPGVTSRVLAVLIGFAMLCEGVLNISTVITAVKIIKHQRL